MHRLAVMYSSAAVQNHFLFAIAPVYITKSYWTLKFYCTGEYESKSSALF